MRTFEFLIVCLSFFSLVYSDTQQSPEINDQFNKTNQTEIETETKSTHAEPTNENIFIANTKPDTESAYDITHNVTNKSDTENDTALQMDIETTSYLVRYYIAITKPIMEFIETPRVNVILKNIGTCMVNGAMEIISIYLPAPLIPLIASAAGTMIPFEPVVMLRKRMPVTSYRRAFNSAVNSFMGTFDRFKTSEEDPYMTRKFNRRFMQNKDHSMEDN